MKFKFSIKLATISLIGNIIIAIGVSTCRISQMGIDPFTFNGQQESVVY